MLRAGAAAAARRRELDISQRSLAADGIINAGALIAFEKGRSWPRERTRAKLEEVLRWPPGTIARLRQGEPVAVEGRAESTRSCPRRVPLIAQAVVTAVNTFGTAVEALPPAEDPDFTPRVTKILADLRQLEAVAARAARISKVSPALIRALSAVRTRYDELMLRAARAPRRHHRAAALCRAAGGEPDDPRNRPGRRRFRRGHRRRRGRGTGARGGRHARSNR